MLVALIISNALALLIIFVNWSSWPWRIAWIVILAASSIFPPGSYKLIGPIVLIIVLASLQSIHNKRHAADDEDEDD